MPPSGILARFPRQRAAARNERLAALVPRSTKTIAAREALGQYRVLHAYAVWHLLRRLRRRLDGQPASH